MLMSFRDAGYAHRQGWIDELAELDAEIAAAIVRRRELAEKINISGRALTGTGRYEHPPHRRAFTPRAKPPFVDPIVVVTNQRTTQDPTNHPAQDPAQDPTHDPAQDPTRDPTQGTDGEGGTNAGAPVLRGRALRDASNAVLRMTGAALTATDIARLLGAQGFGVEHPATRTIPNALRTDVRAGRVRRVARGLYQVVPADPCDPPADEPR